MQGGVFAVVDEAEQLPRRKTVTEKMDGGLRQVVRLVNHKCLNIRQNFRKSLAFQGEIGQQRLNSRRLSVLGTWHIHCRQCERKNALILESKGETAKKEKAMGM